jgi:hypothetical protein
MKGLTLKAVESETSARRLPSRSTSGCDYPRIMAKNILRSRRLGRARRCAGLSTPWLSVALVWPGRMSASGSTSRTPPATYHGKKRQIDRGACSMAARPIRPRTVRTGEEP